MLDARVKMEAQGDSPSRVKKGVHAGLLAGLLIAVLFLVLDLVRLAPFSTPVTLSTGLWGPGRFSLDIPVLSEAVAIGSSAGTILVFTLLHFTVFGVLGLGMVILFDRFRLPVNLATGALYGLVVCSLVFYGSVVLEVGPVLAAFPGAFSVIVANALAGGFMGGYLQMTCGSRR